LLIASVAAYAFTVLVMKRSILTEKVARRGFDVFREYAVDPLEKIPVKDVMCADPVSLPASLPVADLLARYFTGAQRQRGYPVLDDDGRLLGVICASDFPAGAAPAGRTIGDLLRRSKTVIIHPNDSCRAAAERMAAAGVGRLPVVSAGEPRRLLGIITRSDLLKPRLKDLEEEHTHERFFRRGR
jgi:CBS domain-containing protein